MHESHRVIPGGRGTVSGCGTVGLLLVDARRAQVGNRGGHQPPLDCLVDAGRLEAVELDRARRALVTVDDRFHRLNVGVRGCRSALAPAQRCTTRPEVRVNDLDVTVIRPGGPLDYEADRYLVVVDAGDRVRPDPGADQGATVGVEDRARVEGDGRYHAGRDHLPRDGVGVLRPPGERSSTSAIRLHAGKPADLCVTTCRHLHIAEHGP